MAYRVLSTAMLLLMAYPLSTPTRLATLPAANARSMSSALSAHIRSLGYLQATQTSHYMYIDIDIDIDVYYQNKFYCTLYILGEIIYWQLVCGQNNTATMCKIQSWARDATVATT